MTVLSHPALNFGFAGGSDSKESACNVGDLGLIPGLGSKIPWSRAWQPTRVFFPGKSTWREEPGIKFTWAHLLFVDVFIYLCLHRVFIAVYRLSLVVTSGGYSFLRRSGFFLQWLLLWCTPSVALRHVEFSWTRDRTWVPCIGNWFLIHCTTREVLFVNFQIMAILTGLRWCSIIIWFAFL